MAPEFETAGLEVETTDPGAEFAHQFPLGNPAALETVESGQTVETEPATAAEILPLNPQKAVEGSASAEPPSQEQLERMTGVQVGELVEELVEELVGELVGGQLVGFQSWPDSPLRLPALVILVAAEVTAER